MQNRSRARNVGGMRHFEVLALRRNHDDLDADPLEKSRVVGGLDAVASCALVCGAQLGGRARTAASAPPRAWRRSSVASTRSDCGSTLLIVSTTGVASSAARPTLTSRIPARTSCDAHQRPGAVVYEHRVGTSAQPLASLRKRFAGASRLRGRRAGMLRRKARDKAHRIGSNDSASVATTSSAISGIVRKGSNRPSDHRNAGEVDELLRTVQTRTATRRDDDRDPFQEAMPSRLGRAKIIRPATVCRTLVTITSVSSPINRRPCSTTIIVPSSR